MYSVGEVIDVDNRHLHVRIHSEIWTGESSDELNPGDKVKVIGMNDLKLRVKKFP